MFIPENVIKYYEEKIKEIRPFKDSFTSKGVYPIYKYSQLKPEDLKKYFDFIIDWYKKWSME
jgi:hypothetical protein